MKRLNQFYKWLIKVWRQYMCAKPTVVIVPIEKKPIYTVDFAINIPDNVAEKTIFIIQDGNVPELIALKCPCGCNCNILLNLLEDAKPCWHYDIDDNSISITPSIWRNKGCKSHFFIRQGSIVWA